MQEQELFQGYELKNWDFSPRIYKILAASAVFNILALLVVAQSNLLTTKGCDSPLVGSVCQVLDTLVVGGSVLTTDTKYVDDPTGDRTVLQDAEIVWVDQTGVERFQYPEGYRALANPELMTPTEIQPDGTTPFPDIPGFSNPNPTIVNPGGGSLMDKQPELPKGDGTISGGIPTDPLGNIGGNPTTVSPGKITKYKPGKIQRWNPKNNPTISNNSPDKLPPLTPDPTTQANTNTPEKTPTTDKNETVEGVVINKEPMKKFASDVKVKFQKNEIDLTQNFKVVANAVLTKDGKLDVTIDKKTKQPKSQVVAAEGNPQMIEIAKQAIAAIGDSGWLGYLRNQGVEKMNFTVVQDNDNLQVLITSDFPTPERAKTVTSSIQTAISIALLADKKDLKKLGDDERILLSSAQAAQNPQNDKQFVLNFVLAKPIAQEMMTRKLKEAEENPTAAKPNSSAEPIKKDVQKTAK